MALEHLVVYQKAFDFFVWSRALIARFAKVHKYSLGIEIEQKTLLLIEQIIFANHALDKKTEHIEKCIAILEIIQVLIRAGYAVSGSGGISIKNYETASMKICEMKKLMIAWKNHFIYADTFCTGERTDVSEAYG